MSFTIEIITTGDELMTGLTADGNFFWAGDILASRGLEAAYHTTVGDYMERIIEAFGIARGRADAVIVSGGLGPTDDDLTAEAAARFLGTGLELNREALASIEARYRKRGRVMTEINRKQACLPKGCTVLVNEWGTAPGWRSESEGTVFYFLPGVPRDFRAMMEAYVLPGLERAAAGRPAAKTRLVRTFGLPESGVAERLAGMEREGVRLGYRAHFPEVHLRVTAYGASADAAESLLAEMTDDITARLAGYVFSVNGETMEEVLGGLLRERGLTLATAESCTGGLIAHRVTNIPGSSEYFLEGVVSYSNEAKEKILGVPHDALVEHGAVSGPVVEAMARGVRKLAGSDIGVAVSGIAGPGGGTPEKPVGTVYIGTDSASHGAGSERFLFFGTREEIKLATSSRAIMTVMQILLNNV
ncbi:MAG: competence/damage-inducible protein A [Candidatus Dadabacteria bacterium]|nr:competence/damage-inducible protein A [Candidatus Dadabacteria bacterium]